jgi:hypothetical protein
MKRTYHPADDREIRRGDFKDILSRIATGDTVAPDELLSHLWAEGLQQRCEVNAMLADAYFQARTEARLRQAKIFMQRAWLLSGGSADLLPLYTKIFSAFSDTAGIREAYKRLAIKAAQRSELSEAARYFDLWQYAYPTFENIDRYEYDFDLLASVDELAAPHRYHVPARPADAGKIRIAHLVKGITELNSILVKIDLMFAQHHDRSRFELTFFAPETERHIKNSPHGAAHVRQFREFGFDIITAPDVDDHKERLLGLARAIHEQQPHLLVTSAALADFDHYFITTLRPAPFILGLVQGPPPQFAPPILDWAIAWSKHPLMDTPVNCSFVEPTFAWPSAGEVEARSREELGVPASACVLMSGGRFPKFQDREQWKAVGELLVAHPNAFYVVAGPREDQIPFLRSVLAPEVLARVRCLGWRSDFLNLLRSADIVLDTYPSGGGQAIVQAMSFGLPVVSHRNDYLNLFDQTSWNPVEEFISDSDIVIPRGDFSRFKQVVSKLIEDEKYRREVGARCRERQARKANPAQAIHQCEEVYERVLKFFAAQAKRTIS